MATSISPPQPDRGPPARPRAAPRRSASARRARPLGRQALPLPLRLAVLPAVRAHGPVPARVHGVRVGARLAPDRRQGRLRRPAELPSTSSRQPRFWTALRNTFSIFLLSSVPQVILAIVHRRRPRREPARADLLADGRAAALRRRARRRRAHLRQALRRPVRHDQRAARAASGPRPDPLARRSAVQPRRDRDDGQLPLDRLQHADLPRRDAGRPARPVRGRRPRRRRAGCASSSPSRSRCCARRSSSSSSPSTIGGLQIFDEPRMFDQPARAARDRQWMTSTMYIYELGWGNQKSFGRASAVAWILFLIIVVDRPDQLRPSRAGSRPTRDDEAEEGFPMSAPSLPIIRQTAGRGAARAAARRSAAAGGATVGPAGSPTPCSARSLAISAYPHVLRVPARVVGRRVTIAQNPIPSLIPEGHLLRPTSAGSSTSDIGFWQALRQQRHRRGGHRAVGGLFSTLAGFSFSKLRFRGRGAAARVRHRDHGGADPARHRPAVHRHVGARAGPASSSPSSSPGWSPRSVSSG